MIQQDVNENLESDCKNGEVFNQEIDCLPNQLLPAVENDEREIQNHLIANNETDSNCEQCAIDGDIKANENHICLKCKDYDKVTQDYVLQNDKLTEKYNLLFRTHNEMQIKLENVLLCIEM